MGVLVQKLREEQMQLTGRTLFNKGNYGLSYQEIYNKILQILTYDKIMSNVSVKAARILYVSYGIKIDNNRFGIMSIGGIEAYIIDQPMGDRYDHYPFDIAMLNNQPIMFIFRDCMMNEDIPKSIRIYNVYTTFNSLVSIMTDTGLRCGWSSIYSTIATYATYVLTVKFLLATNVEFDIDDLLYVASEEDKSFIDYTTLDLVKKLDMDDLLIYGALCEYVG